MVGLVMDYVHETPHGDLSVRVCIKTPSSVTATKIPISLQRTFKFSLFRLIFSKFFVGRRVSLVLFPSFPCNRSNSRRNANTDMQRGHQECCSP